MGTRKAIRFDDEMVELLEKAKEFLAENNNGYQPPETHVVQQATKLGLVLLCGDEHKQAQLLLPCAALCRLVSVCDKKERKKEAKKERKNTDRQSPEKSFDWPTKILEVKNRLGHTALVDRALEAVASTRKAGVMADSVTYGILCKWATVEPVEALVMGLERYVDRGYAADHKGENYLWGIIRGCVRELETKSAGGNGKPKPQDTTIPNGYPADIYDGSRWHWSETNKAWFPKNQYGKPDFASPMVPWVEGMKKP